jgi:hypothetical protein
VAKCISSYEDLLLWLLYVPGKSGKFCEGISGRTRLVKTVFLYEKEVSPLINSKELTSETVDNFEALHFGPFDSKVYAAINFLAGFGMIRILKSVAAEKSFEEEVVEFEDDFGGIEITALEEFDGKLEKFSITDRGVKFLKSKLAGDLKDTQVSLLKKLKERVNSIPLNTLLSYVYKNYPEMTVNSVIVDDVLRRR